MKTLFVCGLALWLGLETLAAKPPTTPAPDPSPGGSPGGAATAVRWHPVAGMDQQLFPSYLIATSNHHATGQEKTSPDLLGDPLGLLGITVASSQPRTRVKVTIRENEVLNASVWTGTLPEAGHDYTVYPSIAYKYDALRHVRQQRPLSVIFSVEVNGLPIGEQTETVTMRSINDCLLIYADGKDEAGHPLKHPLSWMWAAYVNENNPVIDALLTEALHTGIISEIDGYQQGSPEAVMRQVFAVWKVLQDRGVRYSNIPTVPGGSNLVVSQYVRFVDESLRHQQANCVDGSVLFASVLRKMGLEPILFVVPEHMYMGLLTSDHKGTNPIVAIETTMLGGAGSREGKLQPLPVMKSLEKMLSEKDRTSPEWRTFTTAVSFATSNMEGDKSKFEDDKNDEYQFLNVSVARENGVMPIPFDQADATPELPGGPLHPEPPGGTPLVLPTPVIVPSATPTPGATPSGEDPLGPGPGGATPAATPRPRTTPRPQPTPTPGTTEPEDPLSPPSGTPRPRATPRPTPGTTEPEDPLSPPSGTPRPRATPRPTPGTTEPVDPLSQWGTPTPSPARSPSPRATPRVTPRPTPRREDPDGFFN